MSLVAALRETVWVCCRLHVRSQAVLVVLRCCQLAVAHAAQPFATRRRLSNRSAPAPCACHAACRQQPGKSQHGSNGLWGTSGETPSFLYAMPLGGSRVFLEETCLVARPALPFATLKRRLERRCAALGIKVRWQDLQGSVGQGRAGQGSECG